MKRIPTLWWGVGAAIVIVGLLVWGKFTSEIAHSKISNRDVALICTTDMATQFHIHPHLEIVISGQRQVIPANIGISASCMHPLHTHDASGTLHVESPEARDFTLSDFFAVWGKTFNKDQILDSKVDDTHVIRVMVNGQAVNTYENTILRDKDQIVISYEAKK